MASERNSDINTKPLARKWLENNPIQKELFLQVLTEILSLYSGDSNGYVNLSSPVEYRFNYKSKEEDYLKILAFVGRVSVVVKSKRVLKGIVSGEEVVIKDNKTLSSFIKIMKKNKLTKFDLPKNMEITESAKNSRVVISKNKIEKLFSVGSLIASGARRKFFKITEILEDKVRIQPTESPTTSGLSYKKLAVVIENFHAIDPKRIEKGVGDILSEYGLRDTQNETYLYGLSRAYLSLSNALPNEYVESELEKSVKKSLSSEPNERRKRLNSAPKMPRLVLTTMISYHRNPDVIAETLEQSKGKCGKCAKPAPFLRKKDGSPYLEVHHKLPLSRGGEDTVENAIALCPNCHRESHFG